MLTFTGNNSHPNYFAQMDYVDGRFSAPTTALEANLGRMPVATIGDHSIGQSSAINAYFASEFGLMGSNNIEAAHIVSISEHLKEMHTQYKTLVPWATEPKPEAQDKWFEGGAKDLTGVAVRNDQSTRYLSWWLGRMEPTLGNKGFAVGNKLSLADVLLFSSFADSLTPEQARPKLPVWRREPFGSKERTNEALQKHPRILASCNAVASNANIKKWLSMRGLQDF